jgi:predicted nucleic acid-binding protein
MDFLLERDQNAYALLQKAISCKYSIIISDVVYEELKYQRLIKESEMFIRVLQSVKKISIVHASKEDKIEAKKLLLKYSTHYNDALHKVIAVRVHVDYFVTKNVRDFICFEDLIIKKPDEL